MNQKKTVFMVSQLAIITLGSLAAVYIFGHIHTSLQIAGISVYRYLAYFLAVIFCCFSVHKYNKYLDFILFLGLLALLPLVSFFLTYRQIMQFFSAITFSLAILIGVFSVVIVPSERGKYFVMFLIILILPALLVESKVSWSHFFQDMVTLSEIYTFISPLTPLFHIFGEGFLILTSDVRMNPYELYTSCFAVVAGYMYIRYTTQIALTQQELIKRGASTEDTDTISSGIILIAGIAASAIAATASVTVITPLIVSIIQPLIVEIPLLVFLSGIGMGATVVTAIYVYTKTMAGPLPTKIKKPSYPSIQTEMPKHLGLPSYRDHFYYPFHFFYYRFPQLIIDLERVCMDDKEAYKALLETMFLDPRMLITKISMEESAKNARRFEKAGNIGEARIWYKTAGGLAIYEGDVKKVKEYFGKCAGLSPDRDYTILKIPERALNKAQEYYRKNNFFDSRLTRFK